jgi:hypothetical protein
MSSYADVDVCIACVFDNVTENISRSRCPVTPILTKFLRNNYVASIIKSHHFRCTISSSWKVKINSRICLSKRDNARDLVLTLLNHCSQAIKICVQCINVKGTRRSEVCHALNRNITNNRNDISNSSTCYKRNRSTTSYTSTSHGIVCGQCLERRVLIYKEISI